MKTTLKYDHEGYLVEVFQYQNNILKYYYQAKRNVFKKIYYQKTTQKYYFIYQQECCLNASMIGNVLRITSKDKKGGNPTLRQTIKSVNGALSSFRIKEDLINDWLNR